MIDVELYNRTRQAIISEYNDDIALKGFCCAIYVTIHRDEIYIPNTRYYNQLRDSNDNYKLPIDTEIVICILRLSISDRYVLVDGYHRLSALPEEVKMINAVLLTKELLK